MHTIISSTSRLKGSRIVHNIIIEFEVSYETVYCSWLHIADRKISFEYCIEHCMRPFVWTRFWRSGVNLAKLTHYCFKFYSENLNAKSKCCTPARNYCLTEPFRGARVRFRGVLCWNNNLVWQRFKATSFKMKYAASSQRSYVGKLWEIVFVEMISIECQLGRDQFKI